MVVALLMFLGLASLTLRVWPVGTTVASAPVDGSTGAIGTSLFSDYVLPFEVVSFLLLAALIGAIVLARKDDGGRMIRLPLVLVFAAVLFSAGVYGVLARRNAVMVLMAIELMLNAVNVNLVAFSASLKDVTGQMFALFVIAVAAAEVGIGLAIVILMFRNRASINVDEVDLLKW